MATASKHPVIREEDQTAEESRLGWILSMNMVKLKFFSYARLMMQHPCPKTPLRSEKLSNVLSEKLPKHIRKLKEAKLIDGTKIKIAPHPSLNVVKCWARCSDAVELDEDQLLAELHPQEVIAPSLSNEAEGSSQPPGKKLGVEEANKPETMEIDVNNIYEIFEMISGDEVLDDTADADDEEDNV
ncbi:conserved hypothetical protein [Culex quinquefasciatus]|uniref:Uncharacterized protein n=1 Tax=Culex quinquefasciatus TaxID=7176 RepID=B0X716_CULQU|nr:conserved hypothetical protein [Culex quinquefasciatus]|eukprot:XP_001865438.1 conserved hypothetical protein [Culex quinquefasciatus]